MGKQLFVNNFNTYLAADLSDSATTLTLQSATGAPSISGGSGDWFMLHLVANDGTKEIVKCTAISGVTCTIVRAQEGTIASAFTLDPATVVSVRLTKGSLEQIQNDIDERLVISENLADLADVPTALGNLGITATAAELNQLDGVTIGGTSAGDPVTIDATQTLTNKTLASPSITNPTINGDLSGTVLLDEDDMASDSATKPPSQQSVKYALNNIQFQSENVFRSDIEDDDYDEVTFDFVPDFIDITYSGSAMTLSGSSRGMTTGQGTITITGEDTLTLDLNYTHARDNQQEGGLLTDSAHTTSLLRVSGGDNSGGWGGNFTGAFTWTTATKTLRITYGNTILTDTTQNEIGIRFTGYKNNSF